MTTTPSESIKVALIWSNRMYRLQLKLYSKEEMRLDVARKKVETIFCTWELSKCNLIRIDEHKCMFFRDKTSEQILKLWWNSILIIRSLNLNQLWNPKFDAPSLRRLRIHRKIVWIQQLSFIFAWLAVNWSICSLDKSASQTFVSMNLLGMVSTWRS